MKNILMFQLYASGIFLLLLTGFYLLRVIIPLLIVGFFLMVALRVIYEIYKMILTS